MQFIRRVTKSEICRSFFFLVERRGAGEGEARNQKRVSAPNASSPLVKSFFFLVFRSSHGDTGTYSALTTGCNGSSSSSVTWSVVVTAFPFMSLGSVGYRPIADDRAPFLHTSHEVGDMVTLMRRSASAGVVFAVASHLLVTADAPPILERVSGAPLALVVGTAAGVNISVCERVGPGLSRALVNTWIWAAAGSAAMTVTTLMD